MKLSKCFKHASNMVVHSRLRSWLTIVGIVIGVAAVIAIMSLGTGMQESISSQLGDLGGDIVTITPGFSSGTKMIGMRGGTGSKSYTSTAQAVEEETTLDRTDVQTLKTIPEIELIDTNIKGTVEVSYLGKSGSVSLTGVDPKVWSKITTSKIKEGRMLDASDQNVVIIGGLLASTYFDRPLGINKMITIEENSFRIVGILDDSSTNIYMPITMAYQIIDDIDTDTYDSIVLKIEDEDLLDETITKIETRLMISRHVTSNTKDFTISSNKQIQDTRDETMSSINLFLIAIAAVSLLVGAIGIANTMFTSVLEKTKEIGIMKAIGAKNKDILRIFIINAGLIGLIGGILGVMLGILLSGSMSSMISGTVFTRGGTIVSIESIILALTVSISSGIVAGLIPAYQASRLHPVDALKYE